MKERPILFNGPMVRAILSDQKTQERWAVKIPPSLSSNDITLTRLQDGYTDGKRPVFGLDDEPNAFSCACPFGQPGDRLWVRETFARIDGQTRPWIETDYQATYTHGDRLGDTLGIKKRWTPSIHMPRHASRITLEVTAVRVERLHDITADDAMAEGIVRLADGGYAADKDGRHYHAASAWHAYASLWEQINGAGSWTTNPWVWAVEFRRLP